MGLEKQGTARLRLLVMASLVFAELIQHIQAVDEVTVCIQVIHLWLVGGLRAASSFLWLLTLLQCHPCALQNAFINLDGGFGAYCQCNGITGAGVDLNVSTIHI